MRKWLTHNRDIVIPALVTLLVALALANLVRYRILTATVLKDNKDALGSLESAIKIVALCIGSIFSYYRFFRGRTFYSRAEITIKVTRIPLAGQRTVLLAVVLDVKNIGSLSIWNPVPLLRADEYGPNGYTTRTLTNWREATSPVGDGKTMAVIDSAETATFWTELDISVETWAVFVTAFIHSDEG